MVAKSRLKALQRRVYEVVEELGDEDSRLFELFISTLIFLNIVALILETVESVYKPWAWAFNLFELISVCIFSCEYLLRVWACTIHPKYSHPFWGRLRYLVSPLAMIDLLAVLPFWLPAILGWRGLRQLRAIRLLRLFKVFRYSKTLNLFGRVIWMKRRELIVTMSFMLLLLLFSASLMYQLEHAAQPDKFATMPDAMWWAIATLTTVGYGDLFPITPLGRMMAAIIAVLGIGMFALPTGILGAAFIEEMEESHPEKSSYRYCPHCGERLPL